MSDKTTRPSDRPATRTRAAASTGAETETRRRYKPRKKEEVAGPTPLLATKGLTKTYGELVALAPLDLSVFPGEAVVLIGHNGSGKTTFLRMISGLLEPSDGSVLVDGQVAGSLPARAAVSYISDHPTFYDDLSLWEHLEYVARLHGVDAWEQPAADLLGMVDLYDRADDLPARFSRGMKQKASLALGLIRPSKLLLVDEPFVGLDATGKQALLELLDERKAEGTTLVVATHELEFVQRVERCLALREGELVYDGQTSGIDVLALVS
jgi:ABC-type multidrug transport system ATPase subunit